MEHIKRKSNAGQGVGFDPSQEVTDTKYGLQFHPEKSGKFGLKILQRFVEE